jgi:hypothetical protein
MNLSLLFLFLTVCGSSLLIPLSVFVLRLTPAEDFSHERQ